MLRLVKITGWPIYKLLIKRRLVVRFLISPKKKKVKIEVNKIMNPAFLLGTALYIREVKMELCLDS